MMSAVPNPGGVPGLDPVFGQEPPPKPNLANVDDLGLGAFKPYMSENGFDTFVTLVHFMIHQQDIFEGKTMKWGPEKMALAAAPFVGFGNPQMWENSYKRALQEGIISLMLRWNRKGERWRMENPLPYVFMEHKACDFALSNKGYENSMAIEEILQSDGFLNKWKPQK